MLLPIRAAQRLAGDALGDRPDGGKRLAPKVAVLLLGVDDLLPSVAVDRRQALAAAEQQLLGRPRRGGRFQTAAIALLGLSPGRFAKALERRHRLSHRIQTNSAAMHGRDGG